MMKYITLVLLISILTTVCRAGEGFVITGKIDGGVTGYVSIESFSYLLPGEANETLPAKVHIEDGAFTLTGSLHYPTLVSLQVGTKMVELLLENANYTVYTTFNRLTGAAFRGGALNDAWQQYEMSGTKPAAYISQHPDSEVSANLALRASRGMFDEAIAAYNVLGPVARNSRAGRAAGAAINAFKKNQAGAVFPDLKLSDTGNKIVPVKSLAGKIVVFDFWASWCAPCHAYIPTLKQHYEKYKDKGVVFVSVSVDEDRKKWTEAMGKLKMEWLQTLADGAFEDGKGVKELLHIYYIPHLIIMGKDGKIAASLDVQHKDQVETILDSLIQKK